MILDAGGFSQRGVGVIVDPSTGAPFGINWRRDDFVSTGGETVLQFTSPVYQGSLLLFKNGSILKKSQITVNSPVQVTLGSALTAGDVLSVQYASAFKQGASYLVPSASDPLFANVQALLHFEGTNGSTTFTDVIGNTWTSSVAAAAVITTALHAFGSACGDFTGSNSYISMPDAAANRIGTQDFCIEFQVNHSATTANQTLFSKGYVSSGDIALQTDATGNNRWILYLSGSAVATESAGTFGTGAWHIIRVRRSGTAVTIERDGTVVASGSSSANISNSTNPWCLGAAVAHSRSNPLIGYIDEFRLTIGNARSANATQAAAWPDHA